MLAAALSPTALICTWVFVAVHTLAPQRVLAPMGISIIADSLNEQQFGLYIDNNSDESVFYKGAIITCQEQDTKSGSGLFRNDGTDHYLFLFLDKVVGASVLEARQRAVYTLRPKIQEVVYLRTYLKLHKQATCNLGAQLDSKEGLMTPQVRVNFYASGFL